MPAGVENGENAGGRTQRPEPAGRGEPIGRLGAVEAGRGDQTEHGKIGRPGDADLRVGGRHPALGGGDVGPALQQCGWQTRASTGGGATSSGSGFASQMEGG